MMQRRGRIAVACAWVGFVAALCLSADAFAAVIQGPVAAVINTGGPGFGAIADTHNQNGLSSGYVSGVTDFDAYLATNPTHTPVFLTFEWFSNAEGVLPSASASVTYDLGAILTIDRLALWNEESSGIGVLDLFSSTDGVNFFALSLGLTPFDNPIPDYPAEVFSFASTAAQFIRFDMSGCPQPDPGTFPSCAIGEVAFSVPEPAAFALLGMGLAGLGMRRRRIRA